MFEMKIGISKIPIEAIRENRVVKRVAVRAIIYHESKILMIKTNKGDYKFPGGGILDNESQKEALIREIEEETGYCDCEIKELVFKVISSNVDIKDSRKYFSMESLYYLASLKTQDKVEQNLDLYEAELEFEALFVSIEKAYLENSRLLNSNTKDLGPWVKRETMVLKHLISTNYSEK